MRLDFLTFFRFGCESVGWNEGFLGKDFIYGQKMWTTHRQNIFPIEDSSEGIFTI